MTLLRTAYKVCLSKLVGDQQFLDMLTSSTTNSATASARGPGSRELVAVLELQSLSKRVHADEVQFITDSIRKAAADGLDRNQYSVLTRESMDVILPPSEITCLAGSCLATIGQKLQATFVVGGSLKDIAGKFGVTVEVYRSSTGELVGSEQTLASNVEQVIQNVQQIAPRLMRQVTSGAARK